MIPSALFRREKIEGRWRGVLRLAVADDGGLSVHHTGSDSKFGFIEIQVVTTHIHTH
jgi:hypothetical protein